MVFIYMVRYSKVLVERASGVSLIPPESSQWDFPNFPSVIYRFCRYMFGVDCYLALKSFTFYLVSIWSTERSLGFFWKKNTH